MRFAHPFLLVLAAVAPALVWGLYVHARRARKAALARIGTPAVVATLVQGAPPRALRAGVLAVAAALVGLALAGPRLPGGARSVQAKGLDLVIALDVSQSMLAEDVAPSRLARARAELKRLIGALPGDRIGLVLFAGDAFIQSPLTTDHGALRLFLDAAAPEMMPTQGTDFEAAVGAALDTFGPPPSAEPGAPAPAARVLLLVSDGERHVGETDRLKEALAEARVLVLTAGVGESDGAVIPVYENGQRAGDKRDPDTGEPVVTSLDPAALRALATDDGYTHIGRGGDGLENLPGRLSGLARTSLSVEDATSFRELYAYPLVLALLLLALEPVLTRLRRPRWLRRPAWLRRPRRTERPATAVKKASPPTRPLPTPHA